MTPVEYIKSLFIFLFKPSDTTTKLKSFITPEWFLVFMISLYSFIDYFNISNIIKKYEISYEIVVILVLSILFFYIGSYIFFLIGKLIGGKATFNEIKTALIYSQFLNFIVTILVNIFSISYLHTEGAPIWIITILWGLVLLSKSISTMHQFSETKVVLNVIIFLALIFGLQNFLN